MTTVLYKIETKYDFSACKCDSFKNAREITRRILRRLAQFYNLVL